MHQTILEAFARQGMSFVDNTDLILWLLNFDQNEPFGPLPDRLMPPTQTVAETLLSSEGAEAITTTEDLDTTLTRAFLERADNGLEFLIVADLPLFPSTGTCSDGFQTIARSLESQIIDAIDLNLKVENQRRFLTDVVQWAS